MLGFSWTELAIVVAIAILVIRPDDLPEIMRIAVKAIKKIRTLSEEVRSYFDESLREAGLKDEELEIKKHIRDLEGNLRETYDISDIKPLLRESSGKKHE